MLKARLATAGILAPTVVGGILLLPPGAMATVFAAFLTVASWEWARLAGWVSRPLRYGYVLLAIALAFVIYRHADTPNAIYPLMGVACLWWCLAFAWVVVYQTGGRPLPQQSPVIGLIGYLVLLPAWAAVVVLLKNEAMTLLALFALIWGADSMAYFAGRRWGRHQLAARISPGKTWEGLCGALAVSVPIAAIMAMMLGLSGKSSIVFCAASLAAVVLSVVGDLVESIYKRRLGLKDSGNILPGHGGVLDRVDSLLAAAPVFVFSLNLIQH